VVWLRVDARVDAWLEAKYYHIVGPLDAAMS
jgi:hypothetical protein